MKRVLRIENDFDELDKPDVFEFELSGGSDWRNIVQWYGAYSAGDPIRVWLNGVEQELDMNHCVAEPKIDGGAHTNMSLVNVTPKTKRAAP